MITMLRAGRVSERLFLNDITTGASNDIQRATALAKRMVTEFGMSENLGLMHLGSENSYFFGKDYMERNTYSEAYAEKIDSAITEIISNAERTAEKLLSSHKKIVSNMVEVLLAKETIYSDEVDMLMAKKTAKMVIAAIDANRTQSKDTETSSKPRKPKNSSDVKTSIIKSEDLESTQDQTKNKIEVLPSDEISENFEKVLKQTKKTTRKKQS